MDTLQKWAILHSYSFTDRELCGSNRTALLIPNAASSPRAFEPALLETFADRFLKIGGSAQQPSEAAAHLKSPAGNRILPLETLKTPPFLTARMLMAVPWCKMPFLKVD